MTERIYTAHIRFTWDERKRLHNLRVHKFDFRDVWQVFEAYTHCFDDDRYVYHERRLVTLGLLAGLPVTVVHTETEDTIHVISFRKATRRETEILFAAYLH